MVTAALALPFHLAGLVLNYLPYHLPVRAAKSVKDLQFVSSIKFALSLVTFLTYYIVVGGISIIFLPKPIYALTIFLLGPILGKVTIENYFNIKKIYGLIRYLKLSKSQKQELTIVRSEVIQLTDR
ncbi:MAG: hypothetical protein HC896_08520 [Bacteroidales bacterium]|nr:hypothetical protein [Bacteroidales bacterium]